MVTIYSFLSPAKDDVIRAIEDASKHVSLSPVPELKSFSAKVVGGAVEQEVAGLFDISIVGLMLRAWKSYNFVSKYLGADAPNPDEMVLVPLAEHSIESTHQPYIQVSRGGAPLLKIKFTALLEIDVEGLVLKIQSRRIREVAAGSFTGSGILKCEGVTIVERKSKPLELPAEFEIHDQDEAGASTD
jgi:hypothetical protein